MSGTLKISNGISLTEILLKDAGILYNLMHKIYPPAYKHLWKDEGDWYVNTIFSFQMLEKELLEKNTKYYFVQFNTKIIGILRLEFNAILKGYKDSNTTKLHRIYLNEESQGKGIGKILLDFTIQQSIQNKSDILWLEAMDTQTQALQFYKKLNFKITNNFKLEYNLMHKHLRGMHRMCLFL